MNWKYLIPIIAILTVGSLYLMMDNADESDAATGTYTDGNWTFNVSGSNATIVSNTATGITNLTIPSTVSDGTNTYNVTVVGVGSDAIIQNSQLSSGATLTIPNGVTSIGTSAFRNCSNLTSVTIPDSVTSIGGNTFNSCSGLTSVTIPDSVTSIGTSAFRNCSNLTSVTIPDSVTSIGGNTFTNCSSLTSVTIPDSVTSIGASAFEGCSGLTSVDLGEGVTSIGSNTFTNCSSLTSVTIPDSVTTIGTSAFKYCIGVTVLTVEGTPTSIGTDAFNMANLETVYNLGTNEYIVAGAYGIPSTATVLRSLFSWTYTIVDGYARIDGCNGVPDDGVTIPSTITDNGTDYTVTSINSNAFYQRTDLTGTLTIPDTVTSIGGFAFEGCSGLTGTLVIPDSVTIVGGFAFNGCSGLTSVDLGEGVTSIGATAFNGCSGLTGTLVIPDTVTSIGASAFNGCSGLTGTLVIPDSVTIVGGFAFYGCSGLTGTLVIPASVESIGSNIVTYTQINGLVIIGSPTISTDAFKQFAEHNGAQYSIISEVLNLGETEITPNSYGLSNATIKTEIPAFAYVAPLEAVEEKHDSLTMLIIPVLIMATLGAAALVLVGRRID